MQGAHTVGKTNAAFAPPRDLFVGMAVRLATWAGAGTADWACENTGLNKISPAKSFINSETTGRLDIKLKFSEQPSAREFESR
jgi:hypothetical protein